MVFNATFNNILAISGRSVLLVEETGLPGENHYIRVYYLFSRINHNIYDNFFYQLHCLFHLKSFEIRNRFKLCVCVCVCVRACVRACVCV